VPYLLTRRQEIVCIPPHLVLTDTQGLVLKAKVHSAKVMDRDGVEPLLQRTEDRFARLKHLWLDAGYKGKAKEWIEGALWVGQWK
jgi:putative transposase